MFRPVLAYFKEHSFCQYCYAALKQSTKKLQKNLPGTYAFAGGAPMEVAGSEGRLISRVYQASDKGGEGCIKFWYRIHGKDSRAGSLQVYISSC